MYIYTCVVCFNNCMYIQDEFRRQDLRFLDFSNGYRLKNGILYKHRERFNPFMSLIERITDVPKTVLFSAHGLSIGQKYPFTHVTSSPMWIQVIHDRNKINDNTYGKPSPISAWTKNYV
jgi:hypothetical protein